MRPPSTHTPISTSVPTFDHPLGRSGWHSFLMLFLTLALGACGTDAPPPAQDTDTDVPGATPGAEAPDEGMELLLAVDQMDYAPGSEMQIFLQLSNRSDQARTLSFLTGQRYDLLILDAAGAEVWRWSDDRSFIQALAEETLEAGQEGPAWEETLSAPDTPGEYRLRATVPAEGTDLRAELPFEVVDEGL